MASRKKKSDDKLLKLIILITAALTALKELIGFAQTIINLFK